MMKPVPFGCGSVKFTIHRSKSLFNTLHPLYTLSLESGQTGIKVPVLYARKRKFNKGANYVISLDAGTHKS